MATICMSYNFILYRANYFACCVNILCLMFCAGLAVIFARDSQKV